MRLLCCPVRSASTSPSIKKLVFFVEIAEELDLSALEEQYFAHMGRKGYPLAMLLTLWLYGGIWVRVR
ncbi:MAG: hypothetical protein OXC80_00090 [Gammaproteobacteria bacterium]|nr:hypothetical protein [Gammaproteobacteria bacterium]